MGEFKRAWGEELAVVSVDGLWNHVVKGDTGIECKQMSMPDVLRCLKRGKRKGTLWLPLRETEWTRVERRWRKHCVFFFFLHAYGAFNETQSSQGLHQYMNVHIKIEYGIHSMIRLNHQKKTAEKRRKIYKVFKIKYKWDELWNQSTRSFHTNHFMSLSLDFLICK